MNAVSTSVAPRRPKFLRKISAKTITTELGINLLELGNHRPIPAQELYKLFGITGKVKVSTTDKGESIAFLGRFRAISPDGTRVFESGQAYVPVLEEVLHSALMEAQDPERGGNPKAQITFAVSIGIQPAPADKPSMTGYVYEVQKLVDAQSETDPLLMLETEAMGGTVSGEGAVAGDRLAPGQPAALAGPAQNGASGSPDPEKPVAEEKVVGAREGAARKAHHPAK